MQSEANLVGAAEPQSDTPCAQRLVIRVVLPEGSLEPAAPRRLSRGALLLIAASVAGLLSWIGLNVFRSQPTSPAAVATVVPASETPPTPSQAAPVASAEAPFPPAAEAAATTSAPIEPRSGAAAALEAEAPEPPPEPVNEVLPEPPQSALDTIRGTVRVSVRVSIDREGAVFAAAADDPGPSRYFERLSLAAAKKWTFTPAASVEPRTMLLKFHYTQTGVTARTALPE